MTRDRIVMLSLAMVAILVAVVLAVTLGRNQPAHFYHGPCVDVILFLATDEARSMPGSWTTMARHSGWEFKSVAEDGIVYGRTTDGVYTVEYHVSTRTHVHNCYPTTHAPNND